MIIIPPARSRTRRGPVGDAAPTLPPPPGAPLVLVSASYDPTSFLLTLEFDREVDVSGYVRTGVTINDGQFNGSVLITGFASRTGPATVLLALAIDSPYAGSDVTLNVPADNGLAAVDDGGLWPGAMGLGLPFP